MGEQHLDPFAAGLLEGNRVIELRAAPTSVNRLPNLTLDRRPILTPLSDGLGR